MIWIYRTVLLLIGVVPAIDLATFPVRLTQGYIGEPDAFMAIIVLLVINGLLLTHLVKVKKLEPDQRL